MKEIFKIFSDSAKRVMQLANKEAREFKHEYIGTEHILLGLVKECGKNKKSGVYRILRHRLSYPEIKSEVKKIIPPGVELLTISRLPMSPRAKKVIEYAVEEARSLGCSRVDTEHLLIGLIRENEGIASQILNKVGLKLEEVQAEILNGVKKNILTLTKPIRRTVRKESPIKCKTFKVKETISPISVELGGWGGEFDSTVGEIEEFLRDGRELVEVTKSSVVYQNYILTKIIIFYRDKK